VFAIKLQPNGNVKLEGIQKPRADKSSVLMRIVHAPICGTDVAILRGKIRARPGVTLGHEYYGVVTEAGDQVTAFQIGDKVIGSPTIPCSNCHYCRRGDTQLCNRFVMFGVELDGSFAQYMIVPSPENVLTKTAIDGKLASLLGDTVATGYHAIEQGGLAEGQTVAILGAGPIGCSALISALTRNPENVHVIARSRYRLRIAEKLGATPLNATEDDVVRRVLQDAPLGVDLTIECAGAQSTLDLASRLTRKGGRIVIASVMPEARLAMQELMINEKHIIGSFCPTGPKYLQKIQEFIMSKNLQSKLATMITHEFALENGVDAIDSLESPERMKVLINP